MICVYKREVGKEYYKNGVSILRAFTARFSM